MKSVGRDKSPAPHFLEAKVQYWKFTYIQQHTVGHLEDPRIGGRIMLKCIIKKWDEGTWIELIWLRTGTGDGL